MKRFLARVMSTSCMVAVSVVLLGGCDSISDEGMVFASNDNEHREDKIERATTEEENAQLAAEKNAADSAAKLADEAADAERAAAEAGDAVGAIHGNCDHNPDTEPEAFAASPECN